MILLAKLDRLAIGSILRSKLVFLINVRPRDYRSIRSHSSRVRALSKQFERRLRGQHSAECVDIDNESNQVP